MCIIILSMHIFTILLIIQEGKFRYLKKFITKDKQQAQFIRKKTYIYLHKKIRNAQKNYINIFILYIKN